MTLHMLETLRTEFARIHLELFRNGGETGQEQLSIVRKGDTYYSAPYEFVYLRMRIANLSRKQTPLGPQVVPG
jgi:hypothetical protein